LRSTQHRAGDLDRLLLGNGATVNWRVERNTLVVNFSEDTLGHLTTLLAKFWKQPVQELLQTAPHAGK